MLAWNEGLILWQLYAARLRQAENGRLTRQAPTGERPGFRLFAWARLWLAGKVAARSAHRLGRFREAKRATAGSKADRSLIL